MNSLLLIVALITLSGVAMWLVLTELMKKDETILMWQKAYTELATENELRKLGVMK